MRCLALAQAWSDRGGEVRFTMARSLPTIDRRLAAEGISVEKLEVEPGSAADARETAELGLGHGARWVVVDGYCFDAAYFRCLKDAGLAVLAIDDFAHAERCEADLVLNQNLHAAEAMYVDRGAHTELLLGPRFVLLRREFERWRSWQRIIPDRARHVLISLGGGDVERITSRVLEGVRHAAVDGLEVTMIGAPAAATPPGVRVLPAVDDMAALVAGADLGVGAAGLTAWERAFLGLPSLAVVLAENQRPVAAALANAGAAIDLGWHESLRTETVAEAIRGLVDDPSGRREMSCRARRLVDGEGAERVVMRLLGQRFRLREARSDDCRLLWQWVNEPGVRAGSFSSAPIAWEDHRAWFDAKKSDPACRLYLALSEADEPLGQVRFDDCDGEPTISISVSVEHRGRGLGRRLIEAAVARLRRQFGRRTVHAYIKSGNTASIRAFERSGFERVGDRRVRGCPAVHYVFDKR